MENELTLDISENSIIDYEDLIEETDFNRTADGKTLVEEKYRLSPETAALLREFLRGLYNGTAKLGAVALEYGKKVLDFIFYAIKKYPNTACGLLIIAILHSISSSIPFFGHILDGLLLPFDLTILSVTFIKDMLGEETLKKLINAFEKYIATSNL